MEAIIISETKSNYGTNCTLECNHCGKIFNKIKYKVSKGSGKFCSQDCYKYNRTIKILEKERQQQLKKCLKKIPEVVLVDNCLNCGEEYKVKDTPRGKNQLFCLGCNLEYKHFELLQIIKFKKEFEKDNPKENRNST